MTHAGTMDLGGSAQRKQSGSPWPAIALTLAVVVAMIGAVGLASNAGLVGGTAAKPVADGSYDAIEAQRGVITAGTFHPGKVADDLVLAPTLATSQAATQYSVSRLAFGITAGTFHPGKAADDQVVAPINRPGVSGP